MTLWRSCVPRRSHCTCSTVQVQTAFEQLEESRQTIDLFRQKLIPTAQVNVEATQANYENAKATFLELSIAQRQLIELREKEREAAIAFYQRRAELERAVGAVR